MMRRRELHILLTATGLAVSAAPDCLARTASGGEGGGDAWGAAIGSRADDLTGTWSVAGGTRLVLRHEGEGLHRVLGRWRSRPVEGQALVRRLPAGEARLALLLGAKGAATRMVWRVSRDRTRMARGNEELRREVAAGHVRLKVMTYNIKGIWHLGRMGVKKVVDGPGPLDVKVPDVGANDMAALARYLRLEKPDLVSLQEVERIRLPSVDSQAETVAKAAGYDFRYAPASISGRNLPGPFDLGWDHGNAILIRRRPGLELIGSRAHLLPNAAQGAERRGALVAGMQAGGSSFRLITTHLTHNNADSRRVQSARLVKLFSGPTLLLGDLNAVPGAPELAPLEGRCVDAFGQAYAGGSRASVGDPAGDRRIDYILLCGTGGRALSSWVAGYGNDELDGFSDHRALVSVIEIPAGRDLARNNR